MIFCIEHKYVLFISKRAVFKILTSVIANKNFFFCTFDFWGSKQTFTETFISQPWWKLKSQKQNIGLLNLLGKQLNLTYRTRSIVSPLDCKQHPDCKHHLRADDFYCKHHLDCKHLLQKKLEKWKTFVLFAFIAK